MNPLLTQLSALVALLVLLPQLWGSASLERTLGTAAVAGLAVYCVLLVGQLVMRWVIAQSPEQQEPPPAAPAEPPPPEPGDTDFSA